MISWAFFISSSLICCTFHIASATNQNCLGSSDPKPLNKGIFTVLAILNCRGGGGGGGMRVHGGGGGVSVHGGGGGGVDGWGILDVP